MPTDHLSKRRKKERSLGTGLTWLFARLGLHGTISYLLITTPQDFVKTGVALLVINGIIYVLTWKWGKGWKYRKNTEKEEQE